MAKPGKFIPPQEAERIIKQLQREFPLRLLECIDMPATFRQRPWAAYWLDPSGALNHARVDSYTQPCKERLDRPLLIRISVNHYAVDYPENIRKIIEPTPARADYPTRSDWSYELSVLPKQTLDFAPWIASLAKAYAQQDESLVIKPPYPCHFWCNNPPMLQCRYAWSHSAHKQIHAYQKAEKRDRT